MKYEGLIKKSRTLDLAALVTIFGAVQVALPQLQLDPATYGWVNLGVGVTIALLRYITTGPVGDK